MNSTDEEFKQNFDEYLNKDATINYYIMLEFAQLIDNTSKNMLLVTYDGEIWYPSLYDLDTSFGTFWDSKKILNYTESSYATMVVLWEKF